MPCRAGVSFHAPPTPSDPGEPPEGAGRPGRVPTLSPVDAPGHRTLLLPTQVVHDGRAEARPPRAGYSRLSRQRRAEDPELSFLSHDQFVGVSVLIVDRFRRSRRQRRTRTGCAIMAARPGGPGSGISPWVAPILASTKLKQSQKNSTTTS